MAGILNAIEISSQGLSVQRARMNAVSENIANAETTRTDEGGPYRRKRVLVSEDKTEGTFNFMVKQAGIRLARTHRAHFGPTGTATTQRVDLATVNHREVVDPDTGFRLQYDPSHPDADLDGYVQMPDIEVINEMVDMMAAARAYEANTTAIDVAKGMAQEALEI